MAKIGMHAEAVNVDINQEATVYLMHTGQLSQLTSIGHGGAAAAAADLLNRQSMTLGTSTHLESFTLSHMPVGPPQDNASSTVLDSLSRTPSAMSPVAPRQFSAGAPSFLLQCELRVNILLQYNSQVAVCNRISSCKFD